MLKSKYPYLDSYVIKFINTQIEEEPDFSEEVFADWLIANKVSEKNNPSAFMNKVFMEKLKSGTFNRQTSVKEETPTIKINCVPMFEYMREIGIEITQMSTSDISVTLDYILENKILTFDELGDLSHSIVEKIKSSSGNSDSFIPLLKQSKELTGRINWKEVDELIKKYRQQWAEILSQLD